MLYLVICKKCHYLSAVCDISQTIHGKEVENDTISLMLGTFQRAGLGNKFEFRYRRCFPDVDAPTTYVEGKPMNGNYIFKKVERN